MFTQLSLISWSPCASGSDRAEVKSCLLQASPPTGSLLVDDLPPNRNGGDMLWRINFRSRQDRDAHWVGHEGGDGAPRLVNEPQVASVEEIAYESLRSDDEKPDQPGGLYRVLALAINPGTSAALVEQFEQEMMAMAAYAGSILRWNFGRVVASDGTRPFSHVWEQEFASLADFRGDYMNQPYHWGHLDRWFDSDNPARIIDTYLCNSFCAIDRPVLFETA